MGAYPALAIRPPADPMELFIKAQQIKAGFLGQQLLAQEIQQRGLQAQHEQLLVQGQQNLVAAQHDPNWDASDLTKVDKLFDKYSVPEEARTPWYQARKDFNDLMYNSNKQHQAALQDAYNRFDDGLQAARNAPQGQEQQTYDLQKQKLSLWAQTLPPGVKEPILSEIGNAPAGYDPTWLDREHAILRTSQDLLEQHVKTAQAGEAEAKAGQARAETQKVTQEAANLPTPQEAAAQRAATLASTRATTGKTLAETAKTTEELSQLKRQAASIGAPDPTGFSSSLPVAEYNKRYDAFAKSKGFQQLQTLQGSYSQFQSVLSDLDANKPMTGAASVVALFNAIGISAEPLAGKGFRINSSTIQEHVGARGLDQAAYQKLLSLKNGDIITPQQVKDYASIAADVYKNAYVQTANEAHRQGLPADFLPQGGGTKLDSTTAEIFARAVLQTNPGLAQNPAQLRAAVAQAAQRNGWQVQ